MTPITISQVHVRGDLVELTASNGLTAIAEGKCGHDPERVVGRSPFEAESIFDEMRAGGLDIALWNLAAQIGDVPLARLLGKTWRDDARVVAGTLSQSTAGLLRQIQDRSVDVAIADIGEWGFSGVRRIAYYCWLFRVRGAVACSGSPIALAAARTAASLFVPLTNAIAAPEPFILVPEHRA